MKNLFRTNLAKVAWSKPQCSSNVQGQHLHRPEACRHVSTNESSIELNTHSGRGHALHRTEESFNDGLGCRQPKKSWLAQLLQEHGSGSCTTCEASRQSCMCG